MAKASDEFLGCFSCLVTVLTAPVFGDSATIQS